MNPPEDRVFIPYHSFTMRGCKSHFLPQSQPARLLGAGYPLAQSAGDRCKLEVTRRQALKIGMAGTAASALSISGCAVAIEEAGVAVSFLGGVALEAALPALKWFLGELFHLACAEALTWVAHQLITAQRLQGSTDFSYDFADKSWLPDKEGWAASTRSLPDYGVDAGFNGTDRPVDGNMIAKMQMYNENELLKKPLVPPAFRRPIENTTADLRALKLINDIYNTGLTPNDVDFIVPLRDHRARDEFGVYTKQKNFLISSNPQ